MKPDFKLLLTLFVSFILTACASVDSRLKKEFEEMRRGPAGSPYKTITSFSSALQCMDQMMLKEKIAEIPILIESIDDKTEAVTAGTRDMLISAISEMTIRSHAIKIIAYGKDSTNLISFMKASKRGKAYKQTPLYDIQGSISQHDESIVSTGNSLGLFSKKEGGGGYANSTSLSTIAMDLNVLSASDMSVVPGVSARNSIAVLRKGKSFDVDASINKFGVYFDMSLSRTEGKTQALRNLVELSAIELIGKLTKIPYWQCIGAQNQYARQTNNYLSAQQTVVSEGAGLQQAHRDQVYNQTITQHRVADSEAQDVSVQNATYNTAKSEAGSTAARRNRNNTPIIVHRIEEIDADDEILVHKCCKYGS